MITSALWRSRIWASKSMPGRAWLTPSRPLTQFAKPGDYGQPLFRSHPHLVRQHDLTPGIGPEEYEQRRQKLMASLPDSSVVVSVAAPVQYMSNNIFYKFRQNSDFWYLTGFGEPDSAVILEKDSSPKGYSMTLFCSGKDSHKEKWEGPKTSITEAAIIFGANGAENINKFPQALKSCLARRSHVYVDIAAQSNSQRHSNLTKAILQYLTPTARSEVDDIIGRLSPTRRKPLAPAISHLRAIKSKAEQGIMREAATISGRAHTKTMRFAKAGMLEGSLAAHFEYICALQGAQRPAYVPVVASGPNALIIHYTENNHLLRNEELVLIDAGCEYNGYASDITRTFPVSGKFSTAQAELYSAVLTVQKELINDCTESSGLSLQQLHRKSCVRLKEELNKLGFNLRPGVLGGEHDLERVLYPHYLGHPIGLDLHESSNFDRGAGLKEGMVITIEPGIYVPPTPQFPKQYHNIGIRIEDEVLVGKEHPVVLSVAAPKEIVDVEGACQGLLGLEPY